MGAIEEHFVIDSMLGKLAKWLRILGFDARYMQLRTQDQIDAYRRQGFVVITRNRKWSGQSGVFCLKANDPSEQLREVALQLSIAPQEVRLLQRCIRCNDKLEEIAREEAFGQVPDYIFETHTTFHQCPGCQRVYWAGSHPRRVMQKLQRDLGWPISPEDSAES